MTEIQQILANLDALKGELVLVAPGTHFAKREVNEGDPGNYRVVETAPSGSFEPVMIVSSGQDGEGYYVEVKRGADMLTATTEYIMSKLNPDGVYFGGEDNTALDKAKAAITGMDKWIVGAFALMTLAIIVLTFKVYKKPSA